MVCWIRVRGRGLAAALVVLAVVVGTAGSAAAASITLLGDSWGVLIGPSVRSTLDAEGFSAVDLYNDSVGGSTASQWASGTYDPTFSLFPDTELVHVILGGNDLIAGASGDPVAVLTATIANTLSVLGDIAAATSAPILFTGYDYVPTPPAGLSSADANAFLDQYVDGVAAAVAGVGGAFASQVTVINTHGLMQVHYGVGGIPAFDPSLPDPTLPGPAAAFADAIHLTTAGYDILAQELYDSFYGPILVPEPGTGLLVAAGLVGLAATRRRSVD